MLPFLILLTVFSISFIWLKIKTQKNHIQLSARVAMCAMLFFTAIGHFIYTEGMALMIPGIIPFKIQIIYVTGFVEIALGIGLLIPRVKYYAAWLIIIFFIAVLPANIYAAIHNIDYQKASIDGNGLSYLLFRVPLQLFFIGWVYFSTIHIKKTVQEKHSSKLVDVKRNEILKYDY
jgi:uncharacterized membrane protein